MQRDGFLGRDLSLACLDLLAAWHAQGRLTPAGVGRDGLPTDIRGDHTAWLEPDHPPPLATAFDCFESLRLDLRRELRLPLQRFAVQVARYGPGAGYARHVDAFHGDPSRVVTAIVYLNPDWTPADGGRLHAWTPDGERRIDPVLDRLVVFRSEALDHAVAPASAPRWAMTAWYRGAEPLPLLPDP